MRREEGRACGAQEETGSAAALRCCYMPATGRSRIQETTFQYILYQECGFLSLSSHRMACAVLTCPVEHEACPAS
eukprot:3488753-Rhodomonas_salina.1